MSNILSGAVDAVSDVGEGIGHAVEGAVRGIYKEGQNAGNDVRKVIKSNEGDLPATVHTKQQLLGIASDYLVPMSKGTIDKIAEGGIDESKFAAFQDHAKQTAKGLFPTWSKQIDSGLKPVHLLDPYTQMAKAKLGDHVEPNYLTDPKWRAAMTGGTDPATGHPAPMSLDLWNTHLQTDPGFGWDHHPDAVNQAHQTMQKIGRELGVET
jgi:hypothetical protein